MKNYISQRDFPTGLLLYSKGNVEFPGRSTLTAHSSWRERVHIFICIITTLKHVPIKTDYYTFFLRNYNNLYFIFFSKIWMIVDSLNDCNSKGGNNIHAQFRKEEILYILYVMCNWFLLFQLFYEIESLEFGEMTAKPGLDFFLIHICLIHTENPKRWIFTFDKPKVSVCRSLIQAIIIT